MATQLEELSVKFTADIAGLKAALDRIEVATLKVAATTERATSKMSKAYASLGRYLTAGAIIAGIRALTNYQDKLDAIGSSLIDLSGRANIGIGSLQQLRFAADQNGSSAELMDVALVKLNKSIGETIGGSQQLARVFGALGLLDLVKSGASTEVVLNALADAFKKIKDPAMQAAVASALMGKSGDALVPILKDGSAALDEMRDAMPQVAIVSDELAHKLDNMHDATQRFQEKTQGLALFLEGGFIDAVTATTGVLTAMFEVFDDGLAKIAGVENQLTSMGRALKLFSGSGLDEILSGKPGTAGPASPETVYRAPPRINPKVNQGALGDIFNPSADSEAKQQAERIKRVTDALKLEISAFEQSNLQQKINEQLTRAQVSANSEAGQMIAAYVEKLNDLVVAQERSRQEQEYSNQRFQDAQQIINETATYAERLADAMRDLKDQFDSGRLGPNGIEVFQRRMEQLQGTFVDLSEKAHDFEVGLADSLVELAFNADNAKKMFSDLIVEIGKAIAKALILKAIQSSIDSVFGTSGGLAGIVGSFAAGGTLNPGNLYQVHKNELIVPQVPTSVIPARNAGGLGSSITISAPLIVQSGVTTSDMFRALAEHRKQIRSEIIPAVQDAQRRNRLQFH